MSVINCFICKKSSSNETQNIHDIYTFYSKCSLKELIEKIIKQKVYVNNNSTICNKCYKLLNDFDYANETCELLRKKVLNHFGLKSTMVNVYCQTDSNLRNATGEVCNNKRKVKCRNRNKVNCPKCGEEFYNSEELECHKGIHEKQSKFECDFCYRIFTSQTGLTLHITNFHPNIYDVLDEIPAHAKPSEELSCQHEEINQNSTNSNHINGLDCENILQKSYLEVKIKKNESDNPHIINDLKIGIDALEENENNPKTNSALVKVEKLEETTLNLGVNFQNENSINTETQKIERRRPGCKRRYADVEYPFLCTQCSKAWRTLSELKNHLSSHVKVKPFICEICGQSYKHQHALKIHVGMHKGICPFTCPHCKKSFTQKAALQRHLPLHTGETPYICDKCGKGFVHHTSFSIHKLSHSGEKKYKCNICDLALMSTSHLGRHLKVHTKEKNHSCSVCGRKFAEKYNLMAHQKLHTSVSNNTLHKNYRCHICKLYFDRKIKLEEHTINKHQAVINVDVQAIEDIFVQKEYQEQKT